MHICFAPTIQAHGDSLPGWRYAFECALAAQKAALIGELQRQLLQTNSSTWERRQAAQVCAEQGEAKKVEVQTRVILCVVHRLELVIGSTSLATYSCLGPMVGSKHSRVNTGIFLFSHTVTSRAAHHHCHAASVPVNCNFFVQNLGLVVGPSQATLALLGCHTQRVRKAQQHLLKQHSAGGWALG